MRNKTMIGAGFLAALLLLIFFSKTFYTWNLPEVSAAKPFRGTLNKRELSSGIANWTTLDTVYAPVSGTVAETLVKEGQAVRAGQPVLRMEYKTDDAERRLMSVENSIQKLKGDILAAQTKLANVQRALSLAQTSAPSNEPALSPAQTSAPTSLDFDVYKAKNALQTAEISYHYGAISRIELETVRNNLTALYLSYEESRDTLTRDLQTKQLELHNLLLEAESCRETIAAYEQYAVICAEYSGVLEALPVSKGKFAAENTPLFAIGVGNKFTVECIVSLENNFIIQGDACTLSNASHEFKGLVSRIKPTEHGKTVSISIASDQINAGETFEVSFEKKSAASYTLVPNSAVNQDNDGFYLNRIKRTTGILGYDYVIDRLDVYIGDSDLYNTVILQGITFFEPVVLTSDKALQAGEIVILTNAEDFFEN